MPKKSVSCPVETALGVLSGRWTVMIIHQLLEGTKRFNQLQRELAGITHRTLARQLREMEAQGLIARRDYREIPPRVEYSLMPLGHSLRDVLEAMHVWAETHGSRLPHRRAAPAREGAPRERAARERAAHDRAHRAPAASAATARTARALFGSR